MSNRPASGSPGLSSVANAIHKNNDLSKMSEEEQLEMVMKESRGKYLFQNLRPFPSHQCKVFPK